MLAKKVESNGDVRVKRKEDKKKRKIILAVTIVSTHNTTLCVCVSIYIIS